ncbi:hypothetical protein Tco_1023503, partial [Tanacetum coccineum]
VDTENTGSDVNGKENVGTDGDGIGIVLPALTITLSLPVGTTYLPAGNFTLPWIEKMESVFNISGCAIENQVKFATCTMLGAALTWWNGQIRTLGPEAYAMT